MKKTITMPLEEYNRLLKENEMFVQLMNDSDKVGIMQFQRYSDDEIHHVLITNDEATKVLTSNLKQYIQDYGKIHDELVETKRKLEHAKKNWFQRWIDG